MRYKFIYDSSIEWCMLSLRILLALYVMLYCSKLFRKDKLLLSG